MKCLLDLSAMGLEPDGRRAHLIPYGKDCTLIIDYKGLVELIRRSGDVVSIRAETVCEKDVFAWKNGEITHEVDWLADRGKMRAVYAVATLKSGETQSATMTLAEVEAIKKRSRAGSSGPWVTDFNEMAKKTAVRRLSKMLPLASEIMEHIERDDDRVPKMRDITPAREDPLNPFSQASDAADDVPLLESTDTGEQEDISPLTELLEIVNAADADTLTKCVPEVGHLPTDAMKEMAKKAIAARAKALGVKWDSAANAFAK